MTKSMAHLTPHDTPDAEWWLTYYDDAYEWMMEHARPREEVQRQAQQISSILGEHGVGSGSRLLDAPCAGGDIAVELATAQGFEVVGVDLEPRMIEIARKRAQMLTATHVAFEVCDIRDLEQSGTFDAAINWFTSLGYSTILGDDVAMLRAMRGALRPGGVMLVDVDCIAETTDLPPHNEYRFELPGGYVSAVSLYNRVTNVFTETQDIVTPHGASTRHTKIRIYTPDELCFMVEEAGLELVSIDVSDAPAGRTPRALVVCTAPA
jgi:cyclopropane fatty-acyl-phospholipid synthase-like methyltransferase